MKKFLMMVAAAIMAVTSVSAQEEVQPYFQLNEMPNLLEIMPAPPAFDGAC